MNQKFPDELIQELRVEFCEEARDLLAVMEESLLNKKTLTENKFQPEILRSLHCMKGSSQAVHFGLFALVTHHMEDLLSEQFQPRMIDFTLKVVDQLRLSLDQFQGGNEKESFALLENLVSQVKSSNGTF